MPTSKINIRHVRRNVADALAITELVIDIGREIIEAVAKHGFDAIESMPISDLPGWNAWKMRVIKPNMKKLLSEYRKLRG